MSIRDARKQQSHQALLDTVLQLCTQGRSFSSLSLREVAREVGLAPTAFYRHFQDMDHLGLELVDQASLQLKKVLYQLSLAALQQPQHPPEHTLELFFQAVEVYPQPWIFMIAERWGGCTPVREAIEREINFLIDDCSYNLAQHASIQALQPAEQQALGHLLINLAQSWAMSWIKLLQQNDAANLPAQRETLLQRSQTQLHLLFCGILHCAVSAAEPV